MFIIHRITKRIFPAEIKPMKKGDLIGADLKKCFVFNWARESKHEFILMIEQFSHLTKKEMVEAFVFPHGLSDEEKAKSDEEMRVLRMKYRMEMTQEDKMFSKLVTFKIYVEKYLKQKGFAADFSFPAVLERYMDIVGKTPTVLADEISIAHSELGQLLCGKAQPNLALCYRLEKHSGSLMGAALWWGVFSKNMEAICHSFSQL